MDIQLQELLESIKADGVEQAQKQANEIIKNAEQEAEKIKRRASDEADKIITSAQLNADKFTASGKAAVEQAGRDLLITVEQKIKDLFSRVVETSVASSFKPDVLQQAITLVVTNWVEGGDLLIPENQADALLSSVKGKLAEQLRSGYTIVPSDRVSAGFILKEKDGSAYFDFTSTSVAEALSAYLSPAITELISGNN